MISPDDGPPEYLSEDEWDPEWEDAGEEAETSAPSWRRPLMIAVASITAIALIMVPAYNLLVDRTADNGLEVCGFDYCIVEEAVRTAGLELEMSSLYNTILSDEGALGLARELTDNLGVDPVGVMIVDDLDGRIGGVYDPATRSIEIERPARAWTVLHEVAHVLESGHDEDFQQVLIELARTQIGE